HLDRHELHAAAPDDEYAFGFLARLPRFELGGSRDGFDTTARLFLIARLLHHLTVGVIDQLPHSNRGNWHRCDVLADRGCHVWRRPEHCAWIVHRPDDLRLALLDVAPRDDAVDRRLDADFAEIVLGTGEARALLCDAAGLCARLFFPLLQRRFGGPDIVLRF